MILAMADGHDNACRDRPHRVGAGAHGSGLHQRETDFYVWDAEDGERDGADVLNGAIITIEQCLRGGLDLELVITKSEQR
jgi:hypothetical protein